MPCSPSDDPFLKGFSFDEALRLTQEPFLNGYGPLGAGTDEETAKFVQYKSCCPKRRGPPARGPPAAVPGSIPPPRQHPQDPDAKPRKHRDYLFCCCCG